MGWVRLTDWLYSRLYRLFGTSLKCVYINFNKDTTQTTDSIVSPPPSNQKFTHWPLCHPIYKFYIVGKTCNLFGVNNKEYPILLSHSNISCFVFTFRHINLITKSPTRKQYLPIYYRPAYYQNMNSSVRKFYPRLVVQKPIFSASAPFVRASFS